METYNKRIWLNKLSSPSTGNVVAFDGFITYKEKNIRNTFLSVSDCNNSVRLHKTEDDTLEDFIDKIKLLRDELNLFINHLENN
ncbi:MAG: hypothetical protein RSE41_01135 [Clostridia bacterium]